MFNKIESPLELLLEDIEASIVRISGYPPLEGILPTVENGFQARLREYLSILAKVKVIIGEIRGKESLGFMQKAWLLKEGFSLKGRIFKEYDAFLSTDNPTEIAIDHPYLYLLISEWILLLGALPQNDLKLILTPTVTPVLLSEFQEYFSLAEFFYLVSFKEQLFSIFPEILFPYLNKNSAFIFLRAELQKCALLEAIVQNESDKIEALKARFFSAVHSPDLMWQGSLSLEGDLQVLDTILVQIDNEISICRTEIEKCASLKEKLAKTSIAQLASDIVVSDLTSGDPAEAKGEADPLMPLMQLNRDLVPESFLSENLSSLRFPNLSLLAKLPEKLDEYSRLIADKMVEIFEFKEQFIQTTFIKIHQDEAVRMMTSLSKIELFLVRPLNLNPVNQVVKQRPEEVIAALQKELNQVETGKISLKTIEGELGSLSEKCLCLIEANASNAMPIIPCYKPTQLKINALLELCAEQLQSLEDYQNRLIMALEQTIEGTKKTNTLTNFSLQGLLDLIEALEGQIHEMEQSYENNLLKNKAYYEELTQEIENFQMVRMQLKNKILANLQYTEEERKLNGNFLNDLEEGIAAKLLKRTEFDLAALKIDLECNKKIEIAANQLQYYKSLLEIASEKEKLYQVIDAMENGDKDNIFYNYFQEKENSLFEALKYFLQMALLYDVLKKNYEERDNSIVLDNMISSKARLDAFVNSYYLEKIKALNNGDLVLRCKEELALLPKEHYFEGVLIVDNYLSWDQKTTATWKIRINELENLEKSGFSIDKNFLIINYEQDLTNLLKEYYHTLLERLRQPLPFVYSEKKSDMKHNFEMLGQEFAYLDKLSKKIFKVFLSIQTNLAKERVKGWEKELSAILKIRKIQLLEARPLCESQLEHIKHRKTFVSVCNTLLNQYLDKKAKGCTLFGSVEIKIVHFISSLRQLLSLFKENGDAKPLLTALQSKIFLEEAFQLVLNLMIVTIDMYNQGKFQPLSTGKKSVLLASYPRFSLLYQSLENMKSYGHVLLTADKKKGQDFIQFSNFLEQRLDAFLVKVPGASPQDIDAFETTFKAYIHCQDNKVQVGRGYFSSFFGTTRSAKIADFEEALNFYGFMK